MKNRAPTMLIILDGFGHSKKKEFNAIAQAKTPHIDYWLTHFPHAFLQASGPAVGLLKNTIGNSECGHQTIGAGRTIMQPISKLDERIETGDLKKDRLLINYIQQLRSSNGRLHLMGLLSDGGIHAHEHHAYALLELAAANGIDQIYIHPFLDGRDTPPRSALKYLGRLSKKIDQIGKGVISSLHGRYYAMDRDHNWQRTEKSYNVLTSAERTDFQTAAQAVESFYEEGITDEFITPTPLATHQPIRKDDGVIFFNTRPERAAQLTGAFCDPQFSHFRVKHIKLTFFITGIADTVLKSDYALVEPNRVENTLLDVLERNNYSIFTIAETEKFAHVTYFFNSRHTTRRNETRIAISSLKLPTYKNAPQMSAQEITNSIISSLSTNPADFYLVNYANADMVGHSGDFQATVKAVEFLDKQLAKLYEEVVIKRKGTLYITADHGNAECMWNDQLQQPHTSHTTNPVPFIMVKKGEKNGKELPLKKLSDIAPFILKNLELQAPLEMIQ